MVPVLDWAWDHRPGQDDNQILGKTEITSRLTKFGDDVRNRVNALIGEDEDGIIHEDELDDYIAQARQDATSPQATEEKVDCLVNGKTVQVDSDTCALVTALTTGSDEPSQENATQAPPVVETPSLTGETCSNKGVRADSDPAAHPEGITFNNGDLKGSYIIHVWSNFRDPNLNPQNFPPPDGVNTTQHEFILWVKYGEVVTLPPGTGGSIWRYDCDAMGWADYNREREIEGFYPITVAQIQSYYETGNPWTATETTSSSPADSPQQSDSCSLSGAQIIDHPATKDQEWVLPGDKSWVIHFWSNQHDPNLDTRSFGGHSDPVPAEFIFLTSIQPDGKDIILPVGTGGKAWGFDCNAAGKTDYDMQITQEGFIPITWEQLQSYARSGSIN